MVQLEGLFRALVSSKIITINLFDSNDLLLITFQLPGFDALDDWLLEKDVAEIEIINASTIRVKLAADPAPNP